jgi:hypothetical protein
MLEDHILHSMILNNQGPFAGSDNPLVANHDTFGVEPGDAIRFKKVCLSFFFNCFSNSAVHVMCLHILQLTVYMMYAM